MAGRVFLGELDQLGDDLAAHLGAFIRHLSSVRSFRTDVLEPGYVNHGVSRVLAATSAHAVDIPHPVPRRLHSGGRFRR